MIIFTNKNLAGWLYHNTKSTIMNLFTNIAIGDPIVDIEPPQDLMESFFHSTEEAQVNDELKVQIKEEFRNRYLLYLCEFRPFMGIMDLMFADYHSDDNVVVLTDFDSDLVTTIAECLAQFIYDRWHYTSAMVFDKEDFDNINISEVDPMFLGVFEADIAFYLNNKKKDG